MMAEKVEFHVEWIEEPMAPVTLYRLLYKHKLLPEALEDPQVLIAFSRLTRTALIGHGGDIYAVLIEIRSDVSQMNLVLVPKVPMLVRWSEELHALIPQLRERWFKKDGVQRVEARVPMSRNQSIKSLLALGFTVETGPMGLRKAGHYQKRWEDLAILSLLDTDPILPVPAKPVHEVEESDENEFKEDQALSHEAKSSTLDGISEADHGV